MSQTLREQGQGCRSREAGGRGNCPPVLGRSVNPFRTKGGHICPPYTSAPQIYDDAASLRDMGLVRHSGVKVLQKSNLNRTISQAIFEVLNIINIICDFF